MKKVYLTAILIILNLVILSKEETKAQSLHFSQNSMVPLLTNPAYTGLFSGDVRVGGIYRSQWSSITNNNFKTVSVSADAKIVQGLSQGDWISGGLSFYNDKAGTVSISNNAVLLTAGYNLNIFGEGKHFISLGIQGGLNQQKLDLSNAQFDEQYNDGVFNASNLSEVIDANSNWGLLYSIGGMYYRITDMRNYIFGGASLGRIQGVRQNRVESVDQSSIPLRIGIQAGASIKVANLIDVVPRAYFFREGNYLKTDLLAGMRYVFLENNRSQILNAVLLSAGIRFNRNTAKDTGISKTDAFILQASIEVERITASVAYDINMSDLKVATDRNGAFEIALSYNINYRQNMQRKGGPPVYCPRL